MIISWLERRLWNRTLDITYYFIYKITNACISLTCCNKLSSRVSLIQLAKYASVAGCSYMVCYWVRYTYHLRDQCRVRLQVRYTYHLRDQCRVRLQVRYTYHLRDQCIYLLTMSNSCYWPKFSGIVAG